jgi:uncharacterized protein YggT (Ycf19 family)
MSSSAAPHFHLPWRWSVVIARVDRILDYLFGLLYALLAVRFVLDLLNARTSAGFVQFIRHLTHPFYGPFHGIVATTWIRGMPIVWSLVVAGIAYALLHTAIRGALRLLARES